MVAADDVVQELQLARHAVEESPKKLQPQLDQSHDMGDRVVERLPGSEHP